ncbi:5-oxoprolinase subunit C family protein [Winogradskyella tangerina]|uniref:5-oxoprolinase subunit C family protein n=1 Tax=Winogradskyella tangerina TaxID=2023240 RepID=UPI000DBE0B4D|nr:biotin-dependent carboxyltransferase family protein [Winogradskyella tangerina]
MLKVIKSGFYTTIQDSGRFGYRDLGVPVSGAMDSYSSRIANALLGNQVSDTVLEMTMIGGEFLFTEPTFIAISGANMSPKINGKALINNTVAVVDANDVLTFGAASEGFRTYVAVKDGFRSEEVLNSRSQYKGITKKEKVEKGDRLIYDKNIGDFQDANASLKFDQSIISESVLEVYKGPEFEKLSENQQNKLLTSTFTVTKLNNRMAYQLEPLITNTIPSIITSPVLPGTVQLTPQGNLIVLMRDAQTTGGYPRILQLSESAINCLSQNSTGKSLKIRLKE